MVDSSSSILTTVWFLNLLCKSNVTDAADGNSFVVVSLSTGLPEYDLEQERETHVVESSATPHFNECVNVYM